MLIRAAQKKILTQIIRFNYGLDGENDLKRWNLRMPKWQKDLLYNKNTRPLKPMEMKTKDILNLSGFTPVHTLFLVKDLLQNQKIELSSDNVGRLLYRLTKQQLFIPQLWSKIEPYITKHRGQYNQRSVFGSLYACIYHNKRKEMQFFLKEMKANQFTLTYTEVSELAQALNHSKLFDSLEEKKKFWYQNFYSQVRGNIKTWRIKKFQTAMNMVKVFTQFKMQQNMLWDRLLLSLDNKKGWVRIQVIERILPILDIQPMACRIYEKYMMDMYRNEEYHWRYNFTEHRLYTSQEMIAKCQASQIMIPNTRCLIDREKAAQLDSNYDLMINQGDGEQEAERIKDKSLSLGFAIKDRFFNLSEDDADFSKMTKEQFQELFGTSDESVIKEQQQKVQNTKSQEQLSQNEQEFLKMAAQQRKQDTTGFKKRRKPRFNKQRIQANAIKARQLLQSIMPQEE